MEYNQFWQLVSRKKSTIFSLMLIAVIIVLVITVISPIRYGAQSKILVMQDGLRTDAYTLSRTNEYLGNLFSQIIYSSSFFDLVINNNNYQIDKNYFNDSQLKKMKKWRQNINTRVYGDTGIIEINVYHENQIQAKQLALAINDTLITQAHLYSGNENINIKIIDQPLVSNRPIKPNIPFTLAITLISSFIFSLMYIYIFPEEKYSLRFFKKRKNKKVEDEIEEKKEEINETNQLDEYYRKLANNQENTDISGDIENIVK
jgi:capsular polysaccharide biosynthesis protein